MRQFELVEGLSRDDLVIYDAQPGDTFLLPCWAHLERRPDGRLLARTNGALSVERGGRRTNVSPTRGGELIAER